MADDADRAQLDVDLEDEARVAERERTDPYEIPRGVQGDCEICGHWSGRLIGGACAPCRTRYKLK